MTPFDLLDTNDQLHEAELDGATYSVTFSWNEEAQRWTMSLRNLNRDVLVSGIAVVPLWPMLRQVRTLDMPPGEFVVDCLPGTVLDRRSFANGAASLWYFTADDVASLIAAE